MRRRLPLVLLASVSLSACASVLGLDDFSQGAGGASSSSGAQSSTASASSAGAGGMSATASSTSDGASVSSVATTSSASSGSAGTGGSGPTCANPPCIVAATHFGGALDTIPTAIGFEANSSDLYLLGTFSGSLGIGTPDPSAVGATDVFLTRISSADGTATWVKQFGDAQPQGGGNLEVNNDGTIAFTGSFKGTVDLDGAGSAAALADDVSFFPTAFIAEVDGSGAYKWGQKAGLFDTWSGPGLGKDVGFGSFVGGLADPAHLPCPGLGSQTSGEVGFLAKCSSLGCGGVALRQNDGGLDEEVFGVASDGSTGYFTAYNSDGSIVLGPNTISEAPLLGQFDANLKMLWGRETLITSPHVNVDPADGSAVVVGYGKTGMLFDTGGSPAQQSLPDTTDVDVVVARYTKAGKLIFAKSLKHAGDQIPLAARVSTTGHIWIAGKFTGSLTLPGGQIVPSAGANDAFVFDLDKDGVLVNAFRFGGPADDQATAIALLPNNHVIVAGSFFQTADAGPFKLKSNGGADAFLVDITLVAN